ncbi:MAG: hypothetical protein JSW70_00290 [Syntrophobacterales bacterium]|nr:MAG: hypothetical protein JSW70_00290 [Syntrophobacterales bacterium]
MAIPGNLLTTAMAVMPHKDVNRALELALSMDVPFWPQLPHLSYYEDMYVQASEGFPGIVLDRERRTVRFSMEKFIGEFEKTMAHFDEPEYFDISESYSVVYHRFLDLDLSDRPAIRGQLEGPISFGLNVLDRDDRPILFHDTIRPFMIEFLAKRANMQLKRLKKINANAFLFIDEPGLQYLFSAMTGYGDVAAKGDMEVFFSLIERPRGVHLCGNPDWDFLLDLDLDVLSLDVYSNGEVFVAYSQSIRKFLDRGGIIVWGIVPTNFEPFEKEDLDSLEKRLAQLWTLLANEGTDHQYLLSRSMLSPATCCLVNPDGEKTVEKAFETIQDLSLRLREKNRLSNAV